jgi:tRNA(His) 5'-end guanylyltransferase
MWEHATVERGKPRVYIQQFLDLRLPEKEYLEIVKSLGLSKPYDEDTASSVMEKYLEDLADGSQSDAVHIQRGDGIVVLMTVVSFPYKQETMDRLLAAHMAKKALGTT